MGCKYISYYDNGSGYHFYSLEKGLIQSRDVLFLETTNVVIPSKQMKLLKDSECLANSQIKINDMDTNMENAINPISSTQLGENNVISGSKRKRKTQQC